MSSEININDQQKNVRLKKIFFIILIGILVVSWLATLVVLIINTAKNLPAVANTNNGKVCNTAVVELYGPINTYGYYDESERESYNDAGVITKQIKDADSNPNIKAMLFVVDSGGGSLVAGREIATALAEAKKPTVSLIRGIGASASYEAAIGASFVVASDLSAVGGIGVTYSYFDQVSKNEKDGLRYNEIYVGKYKETGNPARKMTEDEKILMSNNAQTAFNSFVGDVARYRGLENEDVMEVADGSVYFGDKALKLGLIDKLGSYSEAIQYLSERTGETLVLCDKQVDGNDRAE